MSKHDPVVVIGPPRSGTTLMSKILTRLGVFMGYNLNNAFEDWFFVDVNEHIMDRLDIYWDRPKRPHERTNIDTEVVAGHVESSNAFNIDIPWGFKDPRTSICVDVWMDIFDRLDVEPTWIRMKRHPMDVATSLCRRENEKPEHLLKAKEPESRSISTGQINTYPPKSRRGMTKQGALDIIREYEERIPDVGNEVQFEQLVEDPHSVLDDLNICDPEVTYVRAGQIDRELVDPSRSYAYRENETLMRFWEENKWTEYQ